jgi:hypothetical protein
MNLTLDERRKIFDKVHRLVEKKHFNPGMNGVDWTALTLGRLKLPTFSNPSMHKDKAINQQEELLAHDRDIRELMGGRDLYISEVYDVDGTGTTRKLYGRVFYTKGKSLVTGLGSYVERQALEIPWQMPAQNYASAEPFGRSPQLSTEHHSLGFRRAGTSLPRSSSRQSAGAAQLC